MTSSLPLSAARRRRWLLLGGVTVLLAAAASLCLSPSGVVAPQWGDPLLLLRSKRVALALIAGGVLGGAGVILQALLHNPLADPYIIGVSGGAALGGTFALVVVGASPAWVLMAGSSTGGLLTLLLLSAFMMRARRGGDPALLAGVVVNAFAAALITLVKTALPAEKAQAIMFWLVGQVGYPSLPTLVSTGALAVGALGWCVARAGKLELLSFGDEDAERLGVDAAHERLRFFTVAAVLVGLMIPQVGMIGFLGLVLPHVLRRAVDADHRLLLPLSILCGAAVLALLDGVTRLLFPLLQTELPVGAVTAVVFAPIFAWSLFNEVRT